MLNKAIDDLLDDADSPLMTGGRRPLAAQVRYARFVADLMESEASIGLAQGETGTGKTLAYLTVSILAALERGERVTVSTSTLHLQSQVMKTLEEILPALSGIAGRELTCARRIGRRNFVSRVAFERWRTAHAAHLSEEGREAAAAIAECLEDETVIHTRQIEVFLDERDLVPPIDLAVISLAALSDKARETDPAETRYEEMVAASRQADVLVVNHALLSIDVVLQGRLLDLDGRLVDPETGPGRPSVLVIDEADRLLDAADAIASSKSNFSQLGGLASHGLDEAGRKAVRRIVTGLQAQADGLRDEEGFETLSLRGAGQALPLSRLAPQLSAQGLVRVRKMRLALSRLRKMISLSAQLGREGALEAAAEIEAILAGLKTVEARKPGQPLVIYWTPVRGQAGIAMQNIEGRDIVARLWRDEDRKTLLTSATLDMRDEDDMLSFCAQIGLSKARAERALKIKVAPERHGTMRFHLLDPALAPAPVLRGEEEGGLPPLDPEHARLCLQMIQAASMQGGRVLVLVPSYRDNLLYERLLEQSPEDFARLRDRVLFDRRSLRTRMRKRFVETPEAILVSPGLWVGFDLPGMIRHLVIPRLPLQPGDVAADAIHEMWLRVFRDYSSSRIGARRYGIMQERAVIKMAQGIGRGIRGPEDDVTVWIGDPRWPAPPDVYAPRQRTWSRSFRRAVPLRFQGEIDRALIWRPEGVPAPEPNPLLRRTKAGMRSEVPA